MAASHPGFVPDACLINRYQPGAKLTLHRDENETDLTAPIVSVSLGLPATFLWGGLHRRDPVQRLPLQHGDVLVWGGASWMHYHGVNPLKDGQHDLLGSERWNLTFRMARGAVHAAPRQCVALGAQRSIQFDLFLRWQTHAIKTRRLFSPRLQVNAAIWAQADPAGGFTQHARRTKLGAALRIGRASHC